MKANPFHCLHCHVRTFQWESIGPLCGTMGRIHRQQMGLLYRVTRFQDTIHQNSSLVVCSNQNESILLTVTPRGNRNPSQETGSGKGTESGNSLLLLPDISRPKKERKVTFNNRLISTEPIHRETVFQDGDSQVCKTIDETQQLGCLHRFDRCISSRSDTSSVQKISSIRLRRSGLSLHDLTVRNVHKSVNFLETNGRNSSVSTPTCHISLSVPRRLVDKRSDLQSSDFSDKILSINNSKSRFSHKSKEIGTTPLSEIHIHRNGIADSAKFSQGSNGSSREPSSNNQINSVIQKSIGTNFPFSFGQTQCNSRFCSSRQTSLTSPANVSSICLETSYSSSRSSDFISLTIDNEHKSLQNRNSYPPSRSQNIVACPSFSGRGPCLLHNNRLAWH